MQNQRVTYKQLSMLKLRETLMVCATIAGTLAAFLLITIFVARARADQVLSYDGKPITKLEAIKLLIHDPKTLIIRSCPVELTSKATIKCLSTN